MALDPEKLKLMLGLIRQRYPNWTGFSDRDFRKDEIDYKRAAIAKARESIGEAELRRLAEQGEYDEIINRFDKLGKGTKLLWRSVPLEGDLNILYDPKLLKAEFCRALLDLLYGPQTSPDRLQRYVDFVSAHKFPNKWTFPTYLSMDMSTRMGTSPTTSNCGSRSRR